MAILKGIVSNLSGSAGNLTFRRTSGATIVSEKVTDIKVSRTDAQQRHRTKWANIVAVYRGLSSLLDGAFERKENRRSDYNMFVKVNMQRTAVYLTKSQVAGGACVAAPYQITQGSLPAIVTDEETGWNAVTDIALGSLEISASTTIADFSKAVVSNNSQYKYGDQISYFTIIQKVNSATNIPYCEFKASAVILDAADTDKLWDKVNKYGFYTQDGNLGHGATEGDFCYCWVHSRKSNGKTLVSSQSLIQNNSKLADYTSDSAYTAAANSYGTTSSAFLTPSTDSESGAASGSSSSSDTGDDGAL